MLLCDKRYIKGELCVHSFHMSNEALLLLQFYLGVVLIFASSITETADETRIKQRDIKCDILSTQQAYCSRISTPINYIPSLPLSNISGKVVRLEAHLSLDGLWQIDDHSMFHRFPRLLDLRLQGPVRFSDVYNDERNRSILTSELFGRSFNLQNLALWYWNVNDSYNWTFPRGVSNLGVINCGYTRLDLSSNTNLKSLNVRWNNLTRMPTLSSPLPPLEHLYLSNNPSIEFTVNDIVPLCKLRTISLTTGFNEHLNETAKFCECDRLKKYLKKFKIIQVENFACSNVTSSIDCRNYSIDEVIEMHNEACNLTKPVTTSTMSTTRLTTTTASTTLESSTTTKSSTVELVTTTTATTSTQSAEGTTTSTVASSTSPMTTSITTNEPTEDTTLPEVTTITEDNWWTEAETEPTESYYDDSTLSPVVCEPCPGCTGVVIGWSFFTLVLLSTGAGVATYFVVKRRLLFF